MLNYWYVIYIALTGMLFPLANELLFWKKLTLKKIVIWNSAVILAIFSYQFLLDQKYVQFNFFEYQMESFLIAALGFLFSYHYLFKNIKVALFFTLVSDVFGKLVLILIHKLVFPEEAVGFIDRSTSEDQLMLGVLALLASYILYIVLIYLFKRRVQEIAEITILFLINPRFTQYVIPSLLFLFIVPLSNYLTDLNFGVLPFVYVLLILFFSELLIINQIIQNTITFKIRTMYITTLEDYNKNMAETAKNLLLFKHDYKNVLLTLDSFIEANDMNELKHFFTDELMQESRQIDKEDQQYLVLSQIDNAIIRSLIFSKYVEAKRKDITFSIAVTEQIQTIFEHPVVVTRILGNLLDNAIEAAAESEKATVTLKISYFSENELQLVLTNSAKDSEAELEQLKQLGYSSKAQHSGLGLASIQALSTDRVYVDYKKGTDWFEATVHIIL